LTLTSLKRVCNTADTSCTVSSSELHIVSILAPLLS
jgi:hypothetical protein